ncbi:hypothetical protein WA556_001028 [Blastocystis sp. ATCC 50177/Nand II]
MLSKASIWSNNVVNPPKLFELVSSHLYRSNMITGNNIDFIESLHLKTIVYIGNSPVEDAVLGFIRARGIRFYAINDSQRPSAEDWKPIQDDTVKRVLEVLLDDANKPCLVMCDDGFSKTGVIVGCYRRMQHWCVTSSIQEYRRFDHDSPTSFSAELYIEFFSPELLSLRVC